MSKRVTVKLAAAVAGAALLAVVWVFAAASSAASAPAAAKVRLVPIVMKDPGCHWFRVNGVDKARLTVHGTNAFVNRDEDAVVFKGKNFVKRVAVGRTITIAKSGVYRITMVGQHPDDNTLLLVVR